MDKWIDGFEMGICCFDRETKEFVHISNGKCTLDHSSPKAFKQSHSDGCVYAPSEAVALRVVGITKTKDPIVAYTYRKVKPEQLERDKPENDPVKLFESIRKSRAIGRI